MCASRTSGKIYNTHIYIKMRIIAYTMDIVVVVVVVSVIERI